MCQWNWNAIPKSTTTDANKCQLNTSFVVTIRITNQQIVTQRIPFIQQHSMRIFVTPRVVEFSMKSNLSKSISVIHHNYAEDRNRRNRSQLPWIKDWAATCWVTKKASTIERTGISLIWARIYYSDGYLRRKTEKSAAQSFSKLINLLGSWYLSEQSDWNRQYLRRKLSRIA